jgi:hypothetical protein
MTQWKGLWSYVHADDQDEGGRIRQLARDVKAQFEMQTGDTIELFFDADAIEWGDKWREKIDDGLATIAFFMPVLTPRYFQSAECRRELQSFARRAEGLGVKELVLPLLYVNVEGLHEDEPGDDLMALVKAFQWQDWTDLRFEDTSSGPYRRGVSNLAQRLVRANALADQAQIAVSALTPAADDNADESAGLLDRLAAMEETFPQWSETLEAIGNGINGIGEIVSRGATDIEKVDSHGKGFAGRLAIARRVSNEMKEATEGIWTAGNRFASQLHTVDEGMRLLIERIPPEVEVNPEFKGEACEFFVTIRELAASTNEGLDSVQEMIDNIVPLEAMSRDMRAPLRRMRQGLTTMLEAREVADEWVRLIDDCGLDCDCNADVAQSG